MADSPSRQLEVELEGAAEDRGAVRLDELQQFLGQWLQSLAAVESDLSGEDRRTTIYRVTTLSYASPVRVGIEGVSQTKQDLAPLVLERFAYQIEQVNRGEVPEGISTPTLQALRGLTAVFNKHVTAIRFRVGSATVTMPRDFEARITKILGNVFRSYGTFRGKLEAVNLHADPQIVYIYPVAGPTKVRCRFRKGRFKNLGVLLDRGATVDIYGLMKYRGDEPHPFEIEVEDINPLPLDHELPTFDDVVPGDVGAGVWAGRDPRNASE